MNSSELEQRLEESEKRLRQIDDQARLIEHERQKLAAIINNDDTAFLVIDSENRIIWANEVFRVRFDRTASDAGQFLGMTCNQVLCGKGKRCEECPGARSLASAEVAHHELRLWLNDHFHYIYATAMPIRAAEGEVEQTLVMLQDVSNLEVLRRSEEAFRASEQRFRSIFDGVAAGMVTLKTDGSFLQVNPAFCTMLGYTGAELLRKEFKDVIQPEDRVETTRQFDEVHAGESRLAELEIRYLHRDGSTIWGHTHAVLQLDEHNQPAYVVALVQDITQRKQAQHGLEQSKQRFERLVNNIDGIVWEADAESPRFSFISRQAAEILGFPIDRWLTQPRFWRNRIHPEDLDRVVEVFARAVDARGNFEVEYRMMAADGEIVWVRDTVTVVDGEDGVTRLRGIMVDITEKKTAEQALQRSEDQLRQAQKMEAIGRLASGISHDFNNLLTTIAGYGDFIQRGLGNSHPLAAEAREISRAAGRASELTSQLLAFSRQQVLKPEILDLSASVADMEMMLRRVIGEDVELVCSLMESIGSVKADPGQVQQVVLNLAVNARDAMPQGGRLTIATEDVDVVETDRAVLIGVDPGSYVLLTVSDTGDGMDENTLSHLFEPFFTTKKDGEGTGLGLSTVYGIVKQSGGHILVESAPGQGTSFRIYLSRVGAVAEVAAQEPDLPGELPTGTETILLVEDDEPVRELARRILEMSGYYVIEAGNGVEALSICEQTDRPIDLIATDLVMPQMGGRDLSDRVATVMPDTRVLYLSGYTGSDLLNEGRIEDGACFLQKPFTPLDLSRKVRDVLDAETISATGD